MGNFFKTIYEKADNKAWGIEDDDDSDDVIHRRGEKTELHRDVAEINDSSEYKQESF